MQLPNLISALRLALAPVMLALAWNGYPRTFLAVMMASFASDVLDGYLARKLGQTSELGAKLDSIGDFIVYTTIPVAGWWLWPDMMRREALFVITVIVSCTLPPAIALLKFRRLTSYHTWGAKLAALLVGSSLFLMFAGGPAWPFRLAALVAISAALEEIVITLVLRNCRSNVRSLWHVIKDHSVGQNVG